MLNSLNFIASVITIIAACLSLISVNKWLSLEAFATLMFIILIVLEANIKTLLERAIVDLADKDNRPDVIREQKLRDYYSNQLRERADILRHLLLPYFRRRANTLDTMAVQMMWNNNWEESARSFKLLFLRVEGRTHFDQIYRIVASGGRHRP